MKKYFLFLFVILFFSCGDYQDVTFMGIENVKVTSMTHQGIEAEITARIKNPNKSSFTIYKSDLDATLNGMNAGKARLSKNVRIKANSEQTYVFKVKSDFSSLSMAELPKLLAMAKSKNAKVGLKGNLKAGNLFIKKTFPVDMSKNVPLEGMQLN
ncbi:MAG: LEA type 2 family protein [Bacteroidetes bacterium]|nr:LEA type 2 family protein [Bacteroidota bacterium]